MKELSICYIHGSLGSTSIPDQMPPHILGGHVVIFVDGNFYGFEPKVLELKRIHIFPQDTYNSLVNKETPREFHDRWLHSRISRYKISISEEEQDRLLATLEDWRNDTPYDYSVFGKRCFSFLYDLLYKCEIIEHIPRLHTSFLVSIPRLQIWLFANLLEKQHYCITDLLNKGSEDRIWL